MMAPHFETISEEYADAVFVKVLAWDFGRVSLWESGIAVYNLLLTRTQARMQQYAGGRSDNSHVTAHTHKIKGGH